MLASADDGPLGGLRAYLDEGILDVRDKGVQSGPGLMLWERAWSRRYIRMIS